MIEIVEAHSLGRHLVEIWSLRHGGAIETDIAVSHVADENDDDVRTGGGGDDTGGQQDRNEQCAEQDSDRPIVGDRAPRVNPDPRCDAPLRASLFDT